MDFLGVLFIAGLLALIPANIAQKKGRSFGLWWFFGWMLWIVAFPISLMLEDQSGIKCDKCGTWVPANATVCKACRSDLHG